MAGILLADYWLLRRTRMSLPALYERGSECWYRHGWNWRALVAFGVGSLLAVGGSHSPEGSGPFPAEGLVPFLAPLADYGWLVGLVSGLLLHWGLGVLLPDRGAAERAPRRTERAAAD